MITIRYQGVYAYIEGEISDEVNEWLEDKYTHYDVEDLNRTTPMYQDRQMLHGIAEDVAADLGRKGYLARLVGDEKPKRRHNWKFHYKARENQAPALKGLWKNTRGAMEATMGAGKSAMIAATAAHFGTTTLVISYNTTPYNSLVKDAVDMTNLPVCLYNDTDKQLGEVVYAMLPSLLSGIKRKDMALRKWLKTVEVVLVDEAHHAGAVGTAKLFNRLGKKVKIVYGFSGTYKRADDREVILKGLIGPKRAKAEISYGKQIDTKDSVPVTIEVEYAEPKYHYVKVDNKFKSDQNNLYAYILQINRDYIVAGSTNYNEMIADWVVSKIRKGKTVGIRVKLLKHAENLRKLIPGSVVILGAKNTKDKEKNKLLWDKFQHREITCVISTLLDEGTNIPSMDCIVYAGGGRTVIGAEQGLRNTRKCDAVLRTGHYKKKRGYVYMPMCQCPMLEKHSQATLGILLKLTGKHPRNKVKYLNEPEDKKRKVR